MLRNVMRLLAGNGVAKALTIATAAIVSKFYSAEVYGQYASLLAVCALLTAISSLRIGNILPLVSDYKEKKALTVFALAVILLFVVLVITGNLALYAFGEGLPLDLIVWFIGLLVCASLHELGVQFATSLGFFKAISNRNIIQSSLEMLLKGLGILILPSVEVLFLGRMAFWLVYFPEVARHVGTKSLSDTWTSLKLGKSIALRYVDVPKYQIPSQFALVLSNQMPLLILTRYFDLSVVGTYSLIYNLLQVSGNIVSSSVSTTILGSARERSEKIETFAYLKSRGVKMIILVAFTVLVFNVVVLERLLLWWLGSEWIGVDVMVLPISIALFVRMITNSLSPIFLLERKEGVARNLAFVRVVILAAVWCGQGFWDLSLSQLLWLMMSLLALNRLFSLFVQSKILRDAL
jgi:O-antigen/teichoic acid export membrane protein